MKILILGAGQVGSSAAYHLSRLGYRVTLYEGGDELGGVMTTVFQRRKSKSRLPARKFAN